MGIIRLLLAYCVVFGHTGGNLMIGPVLDPSIAVEAFYIISGFYISLVLSNAYTNAYAFWINRMLRLLPVYYAVLIAAFCIYTRENGHTVLTDLRALPLGAEIFLIFNQLTLIFQDLTLFVGIYHGHFSFLKSGAVSQPNLVGLLLIPQAWSLGVEISFYFVAPFIVRRLDLVVGCFIASLLLRAQLARWGYAGDPWGYRFFPSELALFLLGVMAHKIYRAWRDHFEAKRALSLFLLLIVVGFIVFFAHLPVAATTKRLSFLSCLTVSLPYVFALTKNVTLDRLIANFSYPIYICHIAVMNFWGMHINAANTPWSQAGLYLLILAVAAVLYWAVDHPMEKIRQRIKARDTQLVTRPS